MTGIELITQERQKQIEKHGFTGEHHANHPECYNEGQLVNAAQGLSQYIPEHPQNKFYRNLVPKNWDVQWWQNMCDRPLRERIIISGALLAAEIDRLDAQDFTQLWIMLNGELYSVIKNHLDPKGWLTEDWAFIIENEVPKYDEDYNDTGQRERLYNVMYNAEFVVDEINNKIRPIGIV